MITGNFGNYTEFLNHSLTKKQCFFKLVSFFLCGVIEKSEQRRIN